MAKRIWNDTRRNVAVNGPDPIDAAIGSRIRTLRLAAGMSQQALADALGLTFQQVQKYESACNRVSGSRLVRIANVLGVPVADLFASVEGVAVDGDGRGHRGAIKLLTAWNSIVSPDARDGLLKIARAIAAAEDAVGADDRADAA